MVWHLMFRTALAILHFNENLRRDGQKSKTGEQYRKVTYPKYKLGEEIVREVKRPPTYGKYLKLLHNVFAVSSDWLLAYS